MNKIILPLFIVVFRLHSVAQTPTTAAPQLTPSKIDSIKVFSEPSGTSIGLIISSNGIGLQFAQNLGGAKILAVRVGGMYMPLKLNNFEYDFDGTKLVINGDLKLGAVQALLDFHPFKNAFKITGGIAYMLTDMSAIATVKDSVKQGDIMLSPDQGW